MGLNEIAEFIGERVEKDKETFKMEAVWNRTRRQRRQSGRGDAAALDRSNDRLIGIIHETAGNIREAFKPGHERHVLAKEFIEYFYPDGVTPIIHQNFEEQLISMDDMLHDMDGVFANHVEKLGVGPFVDELRAQVPLFRAEFEADRGVDMTFDKIRAARSQGQENLLIVVARILGMYYDGSPEHVEARKRLIGPISAQNSRIAALRRTRQSGSPVAVDVDPTTGEDVVVDSEDIEVVESPEPVGV